MDVNQCFKLEQRSNIKFLVAAKHKLYVIYRKMFTEKPVSQKNVYNWVEHEFSISIQS